METALWILVSIFYLIIGILVSLIWSFASKGSSWNIPLLILFWPVSLWFVK